MTSQSTSTPLSDVQARERSKWDSLARTAATSDLRLPENATFGSFASTSRTLPGVAGFLGDLAGKRVLEYGCGLGQITALLAKSGAFVDAFDISPESIAVARRRAEVNDVAERVHLSVAAGEELPYPDAEFDLVFGKAILHHLEIGAAQPELLRVLRPGGRAAFSEPMGMNPVLTFARAHVRYPGKRPRGDDKPLTYADLDSWGRDFSYFRYHEIQLLSMVERAFGHGVRMPALQRLDERLLASAPKLRRYCRYVVLFMQR